MPSQRFLKALVIFLGVAIVVALGFVFYGVARLSAPKAPATAAPQGPSTAAVDLRQPAGTDIIATTALPSGRLALTLRGGARPDRVVIVDVDAGRVVTTIETADNTVGPAQP